MSKKQKVTQRARTLKVLERFTALVKDMDEDECEAWAEAWADSLDALLDEAASNDAFGTDGQCDPRGDFRNGEWRMNRVEGLDK